MPHDTPEGVIQDLEIQALSRAQTGVPLDGLVEWDAVAVIRALLEALREIASGSPNASEIARLVLERKFWSGGKDDQSSSGSAG